MLRSEVDLGIAIRDTVVSLALLLLLDSLRSCLEIVGEASQVTVVSSLIARDNILMVSVLPTYANLIREVHYSQELLKRVFYALYSRVDIRHRKRMPVRNFRSAENGVPLRSDVVLWY